jgi:hypothetical protein
MGISASIPPAHDAGVESWALICQMLNVLCTTN